MIGQINKVIKGCVFGFVLPLFSNITLAEGISVGGTLGTRGVGVDLGYSLSEKWSLRGSLAGLQYGRDINEGDINYQGDMDLRTGGLLLDWYPSGGAFRISLGAFYNGNKIKARATAANGGTVKVGNNTYNVADESIDGVIKWKEAAPYLGIGWGNPSNGRGWSFACDLGALYTGKPTGTLNASPGLRALPGFNADLAREQDELNSGVKDATFWPVLQFQVQYRF